MWIQERKREREVGDGVGGGGSTPTHQHHPYFKQHLQKACMDSYEQQATVTFTWHLIRKLDTRLFHIGSR